MKKLISVIFLIVTLFSCNSKNPKDMETSKNEKLVEQYFRHFNAHDWNKMAGMYTEVAEFKDPSLGQGIVKQSRQEVIEKYSELAKTFPDIKDKIVSIYPSGENHIIVEFVSSGTAPDNSKFELPICTIFTFTNGLITHDFSYFDNFEE